MASRMQQLAGERPRAVLVGIQLPGTTDTEHKASLEELTRLVDTLGFQVIGATVQKRTHLSSVAGLGGGKLKDLAEWTGGTGVVPSGAKKKIQRKDLHKAAAAPVDKDDDDDINDEEDEDGDEATQTKPKEKASVVVVDNDLSPSQIRNLEKACGVEVLDRSGVIIEIFWRHARTKEAQLQVQIARLQYEAPRLREKESSGDRQRGGGVGGKGDEELELDKRRIRDRIAELKKQLAEIQEEEGTRRKRRHDALRVALVGYTNAGKSSWMRALTGSEVLVADQLFATLGTTVRALHPETQPRVLVSDTVGFIKQLPHNLVASFRSTLQEANEAALLVYVVDAADDNFRAQLDVTRTVLREVGADAIPFLLVLNKIDLVDEATQRALKREFPRAILASSRSKDDVAAVRAEIVSFFEAKMEDVPLLVPYGKQALLGTIRESARVVSETWDEEGTRLVVRAPSENIEKLRALLAT